MANRRENCVEKKWGRPSEAAIKWKPISSSQTEVASTNILFGSAYPSIWTREAGSKPASMADAPSWGSRPSSYTYLVFTVLLPTYFTLMARGEERRGEEMGGCRQGERGREPK